MAGLGNNYWMALALEAERAARIQKAAADDESHSAEGEVTAACEVGRTIDTEYVDDCETRAEAAKLLHEVLTRVAELYRARIT